MMFSLGILEILIVLAILGGLAVAAITLVASAARRSGSGTLENPNLQPCLDCGRSVSVRASTCPHCGGPLKGSF